MSEEIYRLTYFPDEVSLSPTDCKQTWNCTCKKDHDTVKCGYTAEEAQKRVADYYQNRADYIRKLSTKEFMRDMGIYLD